MSEQGEGASGRPDSGPDGDPGVGPGTDPPPDPAAPDRTGPSLTTQVRRRRTDQAFFLRLRDTIQQNHRALERIGT
jgi:hypothetical protein